tara:strand:- start:199 stop:363 length:165 start_codon:yes stop_codon:yes gene_type:complete
LKKNFSFIDPQNKTSIKGSNLSEPRTFKLASMPMMVRYFSHTIFNPENEIVRII